MSDKDDIKDTVIKLLDPRLGFLRIQGAQLIVSVKERMSTPDRGKLLLDTERQLRRETNIPLEVLLEPKGDLSKLRERLRGVTLDGERDVIFSQRYIAGESSSNGVDSTDVTE